MRPTLEDFLSSAARWNGQHCGIGYEISWHGRSEWQPQGIWCWYLHLLQEQFGADDWTRLRLTREDKQFVLDGRWHRHWDYDAFPDIEPHSGWTFGEMSIYLGGDGKEYERLKVGCDYSHERGYPYDLQSVTSDVKRSIDLLVERFPDRRERCAYCGLFGEAADFYTARNGSRVLRSKLDKLKDGRSDAWLQAEGATS